MAVRLADQEAALDSRVGPGSPVEKVARLRSLLDLTIDDAAKLFPGGLREAMEPITEASAGFDFGEALRRLREGKRVRREGWNGRGMWLVLVDVYSFGGTAAQHFNSVPRCSDWIGMKTADNKFVPWLASQTDVLAADWSEVD